MKRLNSGKIGNAQSCEKVQILNVIDSMFENQYLLITHAHVGTDYIDHEYGDSQAATSEDIEQAKAGEIPAYWEPLYYQSKVATDRQLDAGVIANAGDFECKGKPKIYTFGIKRPRADFYTVEIYANGVACMEDLVTGAQTYFLNANEAIQTAKTYKQKRAARERLFA